MKKACGIYITNSYFKIVTMYRLESGIYIISNPIYLLPKNSTLDVLFNKVIESLDESRELKIEEEKSFRLGRNLLKFLKEKSFKNLYQNSIVYSIYLDENHLSIESYIYDNKSIGLLVNEGKDFIINGKEDIRYIIQELVINNTKLSNIGNAG